MTSAIGAFAMSAAPATAILNGRPAAPGAYPWMVALLSASNGVQAADSQFCGGVLVAPDRVLTAAHCVQEITNPRQIQVAVGGYRLSANDGQRIRARAYGVEPRSQVTSTSSTLPFDLAVIVLERPATGVQPLQVLGADEQGLIAPGAPIRAVGWGAVRQVEEGAFVGAFQIAADTLREADLQVVGATDCERVNGRLFREDSMRCLIDAQANTSPVCHGDSGSPAVVQAADGKWRLVGVASFGGGGCGAAGVPTVYAFAPAAPTLLPPALPTLAPVPSGRPKVRGRLAPYATLRCDKGGWAGSRGSFKYAWAWLKPDREAKAKFTRAEREDTSRTLGWTHVPIPGENGPTHLLTPNDDGAQLVCMVRGRNGAGVGIAVSKPTKRVFFGG